MKEDRWGNPLYGRHRDDQAMPAIPQATNYVVTVGGGHAGGQLGWLHFGLGPSEEAEIRVQWPDGDVGPWMTVGANRFVTIIRGSDEPTIWLPVGD